jgi:hypothetical protein
LFGRNFGYISTSTFEDNIQKLEISLKKLSDRGLRVNAEKYKFYATEIEYLGYWITKTGIQPMPTKLTDIMNMAHPATRK